MLKILSFDENGNAVVDTTGFFRVVIQPGGRVVRELVSEKDALEYVTIFSECSMNFTAEAIGVCGVVFT